MTDVLHCLVVSAHLETAATLERIMLASADGYRRLTFETVAHARLEAAAKPPDLIFLDNPGNLTPGDARKAVEFFPGTTCIVLSDSGETERRAFLQTGVDEVMTLAEMGSPVGKHLLQKLLAFKELAEAKQRALQSEERFKGVIEHAHEIILLIDEDGSIVYASPAFGRQTGYDEWEVLGQELFNFVPAEDVTQTRDAFAAICGSTANAAHSLTLRFTRKQGDWRHYEATATNLLATDTVRAVVLNMRDVTAQKLAEEQLENYHQHLESLVEKRTREVAEVQTRANTVIDASPDALLAMDANGTILFISEHYKHAYPASAPYLAPGRNALDAFTHVAAEIGLQPNEPRYHEMMQWWGSPNEAKDFRMQNGTWLRLRSRPMQGGRGTVVATSNITDLKRQQALLAEQSSALTAALELERGIVEQQKTFVSMVSHEFRTPLTIIDGNAQLLHSRAETVDAPGIVKRAATIRAAVDRLVRLIEAILSAHMLESGQMRVDLSPCDIGAILLAAINEQHEISPAHHIVANVSELPKDMQADERVVRQIMANLLSNAVKYSPGQGRVDVRARRDGDGVMIEVQDFGVGIPEKELPRIASKYFRASTSSGIPGTGLGLSLVRQFVDMHKGRFDLRSVEGEGTTVSIWLPVHSRPDPENPV